MAMRLAWYTRRRKPVSGETSTERALILSAIVAAHVVLIVVLLVLRSNSSAEAAAGDGTAAGGGTEEVIHYFDISPLQTAPPAAPPVRVADSVVAAPARGR